MHDTRAKLLELLDISLRAVASEGAVRESLASASPGDSCVIAIGKAAPGMMRAATGFLGERLVAGLVITSAEYLTETPDGVSVVTGSHPVPDQGSLDAGRKLIEFICRQPENMPMLFLISGGASAMVEVLHPGLSLADLEKVTQWLLASGKPIGEINLVRKGLSRIKGGGVLCYTGKRPVTGLFVSDVIGDDPADIGSGLLSYDPELDDKLRELDLPEWLRACLDTDSRTAPPVDPDLRVIVSNAIALQAVKKRAAEFEANVVLHTEPLHGEAETAGREIAAYLKSVEPGVYLWGGETTVTLPETPGRGGRNQQFALAAAIEINGRSDIHMLSIGTDGIDGASEDAGALVDGGTIQRGELAGIDAHVALKRADAGTFLDEAGDLINTGPTGTNVMDIVIAIKD